MSSNKTIYSLQGMIPFLPLEGQAHKRDLALERGLVTVTW
jgi:hypothetical protein